MQSSNGAGSAISFVVLIAILVLVRRSWINTSNVDLAPGERIRPLAITLLDPVASVVIIGPIFWHLVTANVGHVAVAVVGSIAGGVIAWARARVMFVRAVRETKSVILRRSGAEYALLGLLIAVRLVESSVENDRIGVQSLILTALISLAVAEPIARSTFIVGKYRKTAPGEPAVAPEML